MLNKEKCEKALKNLTFAVIRNYSNTKFDFVSRKHILKSRYQRQHDMLEQLIKEFFELKVKYSKLLDDVHDYRYETHAIKMTIRNLCEHFGVKNEEELKNIYLNPPLKFEELKENMWVWDNKHDMFNQILELRINCAEEQEIEFNYSLETDDEIYNDIFEEKRFYKKQVEDDE